MLFTVYKCTVGRSVSGLGKVGFTLCISPPMPPFDAQMSRRLYPFASVVQQETEWCRPPRASRLLDGFSCVGPEKVKDILHENVEI